MEWVTIGAAIVWLIGSWMIGRDRGGMAREDAVSTVDESMPVTAKIMTVDNLPTVVVGNVMSTKDGLIQMTEVGYSYLPGNFQHHDQL